MISTLRFKSSAVGFQMRSDFKCPTSNVKNLISNLKSQISDLKFQNSDLKSQIGSLTRRYRLFDPNSPVVLRSAGAASVWSPSRQDEWHMGTGPIHVRLMSTGPIHVRMND